ncbi:MAG: VTT domain-containing protein [Chloroflexi bacterium]|nr:VTT domain-containing protein [Chloroflexota bacterium]
MPHFDLKAIIEAVGYVGIFFIVFAESGLFFGFFLPGDSLLFTAGFLASTGLFDIWLLMLLCVVAAVSGDSVGYAFGRRFGRKLYERPDSRWFKRKHLLTAETFYEKHGGKTIILARFLPLIRTFAPIVAGAANMHYRRFVMYNVVGGVLWGAGVTFAGYVLGATIPDVDRYLIPIILLIVVISVLPSAWHVWNEHGEEILEYLRTRRKAKSGSAGAPADQPLAVSTATPVSSAKAPAPDRSTTGHG